MTVRIAAAALLAFAALLVAARAQVDVPVDAEQPDIAAAMREGEVVVHATMEEDGVAALLDGFRALYPRLTVSYTKVNSSKLYDEVSGRRRGRQGHRRPRLELGHGSPGQARQ